jgi:hypothetical protein
MDQFLKTMSPQKLVAAMLTRRQYLTLRNTVLILRRSGVSLNAEQEAKCKKFEAVIAAYREANG